MINPIPADEYIYENENARIIMKNLIQKIPIKKDTVITEKMAIQIYDALINNYPKRLEINDISTIFALSSVISFPSPIVNHS